MTIGQRIVDRFIKFPTSGSFVADGRPLGANVAMIVDSNLSWLEHEGCRHLCAGVGRGAVTTYQSTAQPFSGLSDVGAPVTGFTPGVWAEIPWDSRTAIRRGPFWLVADTDVADPAAVTLRPIRAQLGITVQATTTAFYGYFAVTLSPSAADLGGGAYLAVDRKSTASTGQQILDATLAPTAGRYPTTLVQCRADGGAAPTYVRVVQAWVWFGWRPTAATGLTSNFVDTYSAFETRT